jgi:hypothetical protein
MVKAISAAFLLAACTCVLGCFLSAAPQDIPTATHLNRSEVFLLDNERLEPSDNWIGLFCKTDDKRYCVVVRIAVAQSKCCRETLPSGQDVPAFEYVSRPGERLFMLLKGLQLRPGSIPSVLAERQAIAENLQALPVDAVSVSLGTEMYRLRLDGLNLLIEESGNTNARQTLPLFIDDKRCNEIDRTSLRRDVRLEWAGDLDGDQRADFLISASAYRSCVRVVSSQDPGLFLILSSRGGTGEVGRVIEALGIRPQP